MKNLESQKITALGVVIFSFLAIVLYFLIVLIIDVATAFLVLKTPLPESFVKVGSVLGNGVAMMLSTAALTAVGKMKGIVSTIIMAGAILAIKILGNSLLGMGGYFDRDGFAGMIFAIVFALIGGALGSVWKRK